MLTKILGLITSTIGFINRAVDLQRAALPFHLVNDIPSDVQISPRQLCSPDSNCLQHGTYIICNLYGIFRKDMYTSHDRSCLEA